MISTDYMICGTRRVYFIQVSIMSGSDRQRSRSPDMRQHVEDMANDASVAAKQATEAAKEAGQFLGGVLDGFVDLFGGVSPSSIHPHKSGVANIVVVERARQDSESCL